MSIRVLTEVDGDLIGPLWELYERAFQPLSTRAALRHMLHRHEFEEQMRDPRVAKYVALRRNADGDLRPAALATLTQHLATIPDISPAFFASRWPSAHEEGRLFYVGFVAVDTEQRSSGVFEELSLSVIRTVAQARGVLGLDMCRHNEESLGLIRRLVAAVGRQEIGELRRVDVQTFYAVTFAETAGIVPSVVREAATEAAGPAPA